MNDFKNFEHIAGYHKEKSELIGLRNLLTNVENFRKSGVRMPRGVLLYGAPGVGKTVMAKSIATEGIACVELRSADCTRDDSEDYVLSAFEEAREKAPCVLLIDELDKIAESNEHYYMEGNDRIMKVLLQELDGQKDKTDPASDTDNPQTVSVRNTVVNFLHETLEVSEVHKWGFTRDCRVSLLVKITRTRNSRHSQNQG